MSKMIHEKEKGHTWVPSWQLKHAAASPKKQPRKTDFSPLGRIDFNRGKETGRKRWNERKSR